MPERGVPYRKDAVAAVLERVSKKNVAPVPLLLSSLILPGEIDPGQMDQVSRVMRETSPRDWFEKHPLQVVALQNETRTGLVVVSDQNPVYAAQSLGEEYALSRVYFAADVAKEVPIDPNEFVSLIFLRLLSESAQKFESYNWLPGKISSRYELLQYVNKSIR